MLLPVKSCDNFFCDKKKLSQKKLSQDFEETKTAIIKNSRFALGVRQSGNSVTVDHKIPVPFVQQ
jgi:hypothetical protein